MSSRSERFKKLYPKRLEKAVWSIRSIGKLSNRSNYVYEDEEVEKIFSILMFELKAAISKFGKGTVEERFKRYLEIDFKQLNVIKETDLELYDYIIDKFEKNGGANLLEHYLKESLTNEKESDDLNRIKGELDRSSETIRQLKNTTRRVEEKMNEMNGYMKEVGLTVLMDEQIRKLKKQFDK
jgi:hypothetical protein